MYAACNYRVRGAYCTAIGPLLHFFYTFCIPECSKLAKAILILMPLMGFTWIIGVFAVDQNTAVFAWLFLLVNSLQVTVYLCLHETQCCMTL